MTMTKKKQSQKKISVYLGSGLIFLIAFSWFWYSSKNDIYQSQLKTINGKLSTELVKKMSGGTKKSYSWHFSLENQPAPFVIKSNAYSIFDAELFIQNESIGSELSVQVDRTNQTEPLDIVTLASKNQNYITLTRMNKKRATNHRISYLFLAIGIILIVAGFRDK